MKVLNIIASTILIVILMSFFIKNGEIINPKEAVNTYNLKTYETIVYNKISDSSYLDWTASHLGGFNKRQGKIYYKEASLSVKNNEVIDANFVVDMGTLIVSDMDTEESKDLEGHLKSADFFDIENYPTSTFKLSKVETLKGEYNSKVTGTLTILDTKKSISFNANINIGKNEVTIASENFTIDRSDWGLIYNNEGTKGVALNYLISDDIEFQINATVEK